MGRFPAPGIPLRIHSPGVRTGGGLKGLTWREKLPLVPFQLDFPSIDGMPARDYRFQHSRPDESQMVGTALGGRPGHCRTAERGLSRQEPVLTIRPVQGERATRKRHPPALGTGCPRATIRAGANGKQVRKSGSVGPDFLKPVLPPQR